MTRQYLIANINISLKTNDDYFYAMLEDYETQGEDIDMHLEVEVVEKVTIRGEVVLERDALTVTRDGDVTYAYYFGDGKCYGAISYTDRYEHCHVYLPRNAKLLGMSKDDIGYLLIGTLFAYKLTYYDGIMLHGSAIEYHGKAIIFTAPSGVGKSTQAGLWHDKFGSEVSFINDDKPALRYVQGNLICYGSPFAGKHHININTSAKVGAIINVVRDKTNHIERMNSRDALVLLLEETTRSLLNRDINTNNLSIISKILEGTPIFRLYCTPTIEAVEVTYEGIREVL